MFSSKRILVVDDEAIARLALDELLREEGYIVETAEDGLRALRKLEAFAPDVLLTDYRMPGLDGLGLLRQALALYPTLPVIVMSANDTVGDKSCEEAARRAGAIGVVPKPIDFDKLLGAIQHALAQHK